MSTVSPINMVVDQSGIINSTVAAHVQAGTVNKVSQSTKFSEEMAKLTLEEEAIDKVTLQAGQIGELTSTENANAIHEDDEENQEQFQHFAQTEEDVDEEYEDDAQLHPDPLVGNLVNLKV